MVGTKCDLRDDQETITTLESKNMTMVSKSEAKEMVCIIIYFFREIFNFYYYQFEKAEYIGADGYYETSALTAAGVKAVFDAAIECVLNGSKKRIKASKACALL